MRSTCRSIACPAAAPAAAPPPRSSSRAPSSLPARLGRAAALGALLLPLSACLIDDQRGDEPALGETGQAICGYGCGDNGVVIDGIHFWELNLAQLANDQGFRFTRFARSEAHLAANQLLYLDVHGDRLIAFDSNGSTVAGELLKNGVFELMLGEGQAAQQYLVKILSVQTGLAEGQPFWTRALDPNARVETYTFGWNKAPDAPGHMPRYQPMCATESHPGEDWENRVGAMVFEGERYEVATKNISLSPTTAYQSWFNIACAGSVPAKMHLVRRTAAGSDGGVFTSSVQNDRRAFLRMWTADYCGNGKTHTVAGHKIRVRDKKAFPLPNFPMPNTEGWIPHEGPVGFAAKDVASYEAVWGPGGAICLDTPRLFSREEIVAECALVGKQLPTCAALLVNDLWKTQGQLLTANPVL